MFAVLILTAAAFGAAADSLPLDLGGEWNVRGRGFEGRIALPGTLADAGFGERQDYATWAAMKPGMGQRGALRMTHVYLGEAVYTSEIEVPERFRGKALELVMERVLWFSRLRVDGREIGGCDSLGTPHAYAFAAGELAPGRHRLEITVDNSRHYGFTAVSHGWGWSTQGIWNGILGRFELRERNPLDGAQVFAPYPTDELRVRLPDGVDAEAELEGLSLRKTARGVWRLGGTPEPWSEYHPRLYTLTLRAGEWEKRIRFGFRTVERRGRRLIINGKPLWIRGDVDNCQFPLTGYPAMTAAEWRRQIRVQQLNGCNAMRFHTWTPPQAAFDAADELGFYLMVETGYWGGRIGRGEPGLDDFVRRELDRVNDAYGNSPSFIALEVGNELGGSDFGLMDGWMRDLKARDGRRLTQCSTARSVAPSDDYMVTHLYPGVGPVRCRFRPHTDWDYEDVYSRTDIPTIAHEVGQWPVYPLWTEIAKYDGLMRAFDWMEMRATAATNGTLRFNRRYHVASLKTSRFMYKDEVEGYLRTPSCAGLQLLDVRDYTGQGEALVGWLDAFFDAKAGVSELPAFSDVLRPVACLARLEKFVWTAGETLRAKLVIRNLTEEAVPKGAAFPYSFAGRGGWLTLGAAVEPGEVATVGEVDFPLDASLAARRQELRFGENRWSVFVTDTPAVTPVPAGVTLTADPAEASAALAAGGRVVYTGRSRDSIGGRFVPVYWSTVYFPIFDPCPMIGTWFDEDHPAFAEFPTEDWMDRQWRTLSEGARVHELKGEGANLAAIAMPVPDIHVSRHYATMFEARVGAGRLLVCGYPIADAATPEARQLRRSVLGYAASGAFRPRGEVSADWFAGFACAKRPGNLDEGDWRAERCADGALRITVVNPPREAGEYSVLFKEDDVVTATCEGRSCKILWAIPVALVRGRTTAEDAADGRIEFVIRSTARDAVPPVDRVSFSVKK